MTTLQRDDDDGLTPFAADVTLLAAADDVAARRSGDPRRLVIAVSALIIAAGRLVGRSGLPPEAIDEVLTHLGQSLFESAAEARAEQLARAPASDHGGAP